MTIQLYDLAGADAERRFSPYCWRTKLALAHKGLAFETIPWRFTEGDAIAFSGQGRVPVLIDGDATVSDSWAIAVYLEKTYPDRPSLFGAPDAKGAFHVVNGWADGVLIPDIAKMIVADILACLAEKDRNYFRTSREQRFGRALEEVVADRETAVVAFRKTLQPLRIALASQPYLGGDAPNYADYIVFGCFQWSRCTSPFPLLVQDDPLHEWRGRMLDAFDGLAARAPAFAET